MNWIFGAYSSVYSAAMMQDAKAHGARAELPKKSSSVARLFGRG